MRPNLRNDWSHRKIHIRKLPLNAIDKDCPTHFRMNGCRRCAFYLLPCLVFILNSKLLLQIIFYARSAIPRQHLRLHCVYVCVNVPFLVASFVISAHICLRVFIIYRHNLTVEPRKSKPIWIDAQLIRQYEVHCAIWNQSQCKQ